VQQLQGLQRHIEQERYFGGYFLSGDKRKERFGDTLLIS
jgi:hypothetical protein